MTNLMQRQRGLGYASALVGWSILLGAYLKPAWLMALVIILGGLLAYVPPPGEADEGPMSTHQSTS